MVLKDGIVIFTHCKILFLSRLLTLLGVPFLIPCCVELKAVPSLRRGQGGRALLIWFARNAVFGTSLNEKTTDNDGKKNNYVQT